MSVRNLSLFKGIRQSVFMNEQEHRSVCVEYINNCILCVYHVRLHLGHLHASPSKVQHKHMATTSAFTIHFFMRKRKMKG